MALKFERELADAAEQRRASYVMMAFRCARNEAMPGTEVEAACEAAGRTPDEFRRLVARCVARKQAASDLKRADELQAEQTRIGERLEKAHAAVKAAEERVEELRREQMAVLGESSALSNRVNSLRASAVNVLQATADPAAADWRDPAAVRLDDPTPQAAALPLPSFGSWCPGESATLPQMQVVGRR